MTIRRQYFDGPIQFVCDFCGDEFDTGTEDFTEAREAFSEHGGKSVRHPGGQWEHHCKDCLGFA